MQQQGEGILIIAPKAAADKLAGALTMHGYNVLQPTDSAYRGIAIANEQGAALAVVAHSLHGIDGSTTAHQLERVCPVLLLCTAQQSEWLGALGRHIMLMTTPLKTRPFIEAVELCLKSTRKPAPKPPATRSSLQKQIISRAKQRLMDVHNIDEPTAHRQIQRMSMDSGKPLSEVAKIVLELL